VHPILLKPRNQNKLIWFVNSWLSALAKPIGFE